MKILSSITKIKQFFCRHSKTRVDYYMKNGIANAKLTCSKCSKKISDDNDTLNLYLTPNFYDLYASNINIKESQ